MDQVTLKANIRDSLGKADANRLRNQGFVPGVYYTKTDAGNIHLRVKSNELEKAVSGERGMNTLIKLDVEGGESYDVLIGDFQADPIKRNFTHADFVPVNVNEEVKVTIPLNITGRAQGVKDGGVLDILRHDLEVICLPGKIPSKINLDITKLGLGENIHLEDLELPEGVKPVIQQNVTIVNIPAPKKAKSEEAEAGAEPAADAGEENKSAE